MPELLTRISIRPNRFTVLSTIERHDSSLQTSTSRAAVFTLNASIALAASRFFSARRPATTITAPAAANPFAMPNPIPALPPVMTATRPFGSRVFCGAVRAVIGRARLYMTRRRYRHRIPHTGGVAEQEVAGAVEQLQCRRLQRALACGAALQIKLI